LYCRIFPSELLKTLLKRLKSACFSPFGSFLRRVLNRVFNNLWKTIHKTPRKICRVKMGFRRVFSCESAHFLSFDGFAALMPRRTGARRALLSEERFSTVFHLHALFVERRPV
jgi:hypothetical protein